MVDHVFTLVFYSFFQILRLFSALFVDFQKSRNLTIFLSSKIQKLGTKTALNITLDGILEFRTKFLMFLCIFSWLQRHFWTFYLNLNSTHQKNFAPNFSSICGHKWETTLKSKLVVKMSNSSFVLISCWYLLVCRK